MKGRHELRNEVLQVERRFGLWRVDQDKVSFPSYRYKKVNVLMTADGLLDRQFRASIAQDFQIFILDTFSGHERDEATHQLNLH